MEIVTKFLDWVLKLLPTSPFAAYIDALENIPFLAYLNYFLPISTFVAIGEAWLVAVGLFYLYSIILRWIRAIE
ncbi:MAG TPA: hypothetical protein DIV51_02905 [Lachnospiraceae bacterium]|jgi:hypothetical protein|nr:hypothetical protein [Lachnospiraceae bacterium]